MLPIYCKRLFEHLEFGFEGKMEIEMNTLKNAFSAPFSVFSRVSVYLLAGLIACGFAAPTGAQTRRNDRDTRDIVRNLKSKIDDFQYNLTYQLKNNSADQDEVTEVDRDLRDLTDKVNAFQDNFDRKRENRDDVSRILNSARNISDYLRQNQQNRKFDADWAGIRSLLDRLAVNYNVQPNGGYNRNSGSYPNNSPTNNNNYPDDNRYPNQNPNQNNRNTNNYPSNGGNANNYGLTGTYQLDVSKSENTNDVITDSRVGDDKRAELADKLTAPEQLAIDVRGSQVTLASSKAAPVTLNADGRDISQTTTDGRTIRVRATLRGQELTISSDGGATNYSVSFVASDDGQTLKVTRRITTDYLNQTVIADSVYNKTDAVARLGINGGGANNNYPNSTANNDQNGDYSSSDSNDRNNPNGNSPNNRPTTSNARTGSFVVPNGTILTGTLDNPINTKLSQNNDRFKMTVQSPDEYRGATVEGYLSGVNRSGKVSGRSNITFNFERITLRGGQTYDFAGYLQGITDQNGKVVKIDAEGSAQGGSQTKETAKRGGIGAGIGAVIGAIAGGGTGAAIGAVIGGGAGAGSVILQGKDDLELGQGSTITVQSSSPAR